MRWLFVLTLIPLLALGDSEVSNDYQPPALSLWSETSPDGHYMAAERIMPDSIYLWKTDLDGARLLVRTLKTSGTDTYVAYDLSRLIAQIAWNPDSRYIVLTTVSAGGHSPWHFNA
ncbi:MAG TPA: hypothetical protein VHY09_06725 [Candidatus Methylacidiphilales bacterium]|jgi:Tol biopolymer transport system component|nr:hypothetical protein [Candidatus Methylacidiphilales bacterium]